MIVKSLVFPLPDPQLLQKGYSLDLKNSCCSTWHPATDHMDFVLSDLRYKTNPTSWKTRLALDRHALLAQSYIQAEQGWAESSTSESPLSVICFIQDARR